jgi:hypothetical protein
MAWHVLRFGLWNVRSTVQHPFIDFKKALGLKYCTIFSQSWGTYESSRAGLKCLNEMRSKVCIYKHLSDDVSIQNGLKQEDS